MSPLSYRAATRHSVGSPQSTTRRMKTHPHLQHIRPKETRGAIRGAEAQVNKPAECAPTGSSLSRRVRLTAGFLRSVASLRDNSRTVCRSAIPAGTGGLKRLSFAYFSLPLQRKVGAAPHRGNANKPIRQRGCQRSKNLPPEGKTKDTDPCLK